MIDMLFEKLPAEEVDILTKYVDVFCTQESYRGISMKEYLRFWDANKTHFFNGMFKENFILTKKISLKKSHEEKETDMRNALWNENGKEGRMSPFRQKYTDKIFQLENNNTINYVLAIKLRELMNSSRLVDNVYLDESFEIPLPGNKKYRVLNGHKLMKIFAKIASAYEIEGFEEFRLAHSQVLNDLEFHGELCLSIHPMDFLTMSDNNCDWSSCMSIIDSGDYRRGVIEMMNSGCVVMAYLKSSTDMKIPYIEEDIFWNNKKWRELFIISDEAIVGIKGYPYWNLELQELVIKWIAELNEGYYEDEVIQFDYDASVRIRDHKFIFETCDMYNDFVYDKHAICLKKNLEPNTYYINYSGPMVCIGCGTATGYYSKDACNFLACEDCYNPTYCADCGCLINDEDAVWFNDRPYCSYCFGQIPTCFECEELTDDYTVVSIRFDHDDNQIARNFTISLCDDCYKGYEENGLIKICKNVRWYGDVRYIDAEYINDEKFFDLFGVDKKDRDNIEDRYYHRQAIYYDLTPIRTEVAPIVW
ncbi:MAG: hypothetical protein E7167_01200 [Firmicutes bacterium]|nr:hypothetical protein [Bacillota bacterium]